NERKSGSSTTVVQTTDFNKRNGPRPELERNTDKMTPDANTQKTYSQIVKRARIAISKTKSEIFDQDQWTHNKMITALSNPADFKELM
ncbi:17938_t:CDS:2, partial [Gigaspora rosea]